MRGPRAPARGPVPHPLVKSRRTARRRTRDPSRPPRYCTALTRPRLIAKAVEDAGREGPRNCALVPRRVPEPSRISIHYGSSPLRGSQLGRRPPGSGAIPRQPSECGPAKEVLARDIERRSPGATVHSDPDALPAPLCRKARARGSPLRILSGWSWSGVHDRSEAGCGVRVTPRDACTPRSWVLHNS